MSQLLQQLDVAIGTRHYSPRTRQAYRRWVIRFVRFCGVQHPQGCGEEEVRAFVEHLAVKRRLSTSSQNQVRAALSFLYRDVLGQPLSRLPAEGRPTPVVRVPKVIDPVEVDRILLHLEGTPRLVVMLLYGGGLSLNEALHLRVKDIDLARRTLVVRSGRGNKERRTM
ncbi:MAG: phage integrase N-terminal SAM-like domain-containing protein [Gemmatimonadaceae bacterium]